MKHFFYAALLTAILFFACAPKPAPEKQFPIMAWYGAIPQVISKTDFDLLRQSGFTHVLLESDSRHQNQGLLAFADSAHIKVFIEDERIDALKSADSLHLAVIDSIFKNYTSHSSFQGFYLDAKPHVRALPQLKKICAAFHQVAPAYPPFINLWAAHDMPVDYGASDVHRYYSAVLDSLDLSIISADNYGVQADTLTHDFFETLVALRNISQREHKGFWGYALIVSFMDYIVPRHSYLRAQLYGALAFGAKGVQYYSFHPPVDTRRLNYGPALTDSDGNFTPLMQNVIEINGELVHVGNVLQHLQFQQAYHTIPSPMEELQWIPGLLVEKIDGNFLAGFFNSEDAQQYVLFANMNVDHGHVAEIIFAQNVEQVFQLNKQTGQEFSVPWLDKQGKRVKILFKAGDAELLRLQLAAEE